MPFRSHPRLILVLALAVGIGFGTIGAGVPRHLTFKANDSSSHFSESFRATHELETVRNKSWWGPPNLSVVFRESSEGGAIGVLGQLEQLPQIAKVENYIFPSKDGKADFVVAWLRRDLPEADAAAAVADRLNGPGIVVGGPALAGHEFAETISRDLRRAELIAFPLFVLFGLWIFRSLVSALLPAAVGGLALLCTLGCMRAATELFPLSVFSLNIAVAVSLGLAVDYSLLLLSRFREELACGASPAAGARSAERTAGRTIMFSSGMLFISFAALLVFPIPVIRSMAVAGMLVAPLAGLTAVAVLPAIFVVLGRRVNALAPRAWQRSLAIRSQPRRAGGWFRLAQFVTRRPVIACLSATVLLIGLGVPALSMRFTGLDVTSLPPSSSARSLTERVQREFEHPISGEIQTVVAGGRRQAKRVANRLVRLTQRTRLAIPFPVAIEVMPRLYLMNLNPASPPLSSSTKDLVERLRKMRAPMAVTGDTATYLDTVATLKQNLPYALIVLVSGAYFILWWATGSLVLPVKALVINLLTLAAAFGLLVILFQDGNLEGALAYRSQDALVITLPIVVVACAFGVLTDYGLFLFMRIKEAREEGLANRDAITLGLERSARVIPGAAVLFCVGVGAFATSDILFLKEGAIAIAAAVALDAFVVRPLLVPGLMVLLGRWNWWPRRIA
jgi:uncharacterized membrane protein YdfJ with MMPL/SSD domain